MNRSNVAIIAVATLLLGSGVSGLMWVKPAWEEQQKLKTNKADLSTQKASLEAQVADLEAKVKRQAMGTISYFDLRTVPNQRREMEAKTVETLASLTEIFNDNKIDVQMLEPKGETQGLSKPVPTPAPSGSPGASPSPGAPGAPGAPPPPAAPAGAPATPAGPPTEPPVQLTHKAFSFSVRGEYPNLVRALSEIQGLPRAISINQYNVELVVKPEDKPKAPQPDAPVVSDSMLELEFDLSITYLMAGGLPMGTPGAAPAAPPAAKPVSLELLHWAANWLCAPAEAAEARPTHVLAGVTGSGPDLVVRTGRGVPRFRYGGSASRLVIELEDTRVADAPAFAARVPGVRAVSARAAGTGAVLVVETDGTRFVPAYAGNQLRLVRHGAAAIASRGDARPATRATLHPAFQAAALPDGTEPPAMTAHAPEKAGRAAKPAAKAPSRGQKAGKGDAAAARRVAPVARPDIAGVETWSTLSARAAAEWASTQGADPDAFTPPVGPAAVPAPAAAAPVVAQAPAAVHAPAAHAPSPLAAPAERPAAWKPALVPAEAPARPAAAQAAAAKPTASYAQPGTPAARPAAPAVRLVTKVVTAAARPAAAADAAPVTRVRSVAYEKGALVVHTAGPAPTFKVVGGDRRSLVLELDQAQTPGGGRAYAVGQAGVRQVRVARYDDHPPRVRLVVDTDGSVAVHPVMGPDGVLRLRLAERPGLAHEVRLASAGSSAIVTSTKENPVTRDPSAFKPKAPLRTVAPKPAAAPKAAATPKPKRVVVVREPARRIVRGPAAEAAVRRAEARRTRPELPVAAAKPAARPVPTATPTPMAVPSSRPGAKPAGVPGAQPGKPAPGAKPSPATTPEAAVPATPAPTPPGPTLTRSLSSTYSFPIDREKTTGRQNPFKPITKPKGQFDRKGAATPPPPPSKPGLLGNLLPGLPVPGAAGGPGGVPAMPKAPGASGGGYALGGVLVGAGGPPMALITIGGKAYTVGLNETLPGNARVTAIRVDHVVLNADGREVTLFLKR